MPDLYATIAEVDREIQDHLADVLEMRASDNQQREMLESYLSEIDFPHESRVLELGSGTGAVTRTIANWPSVLEAVGIDPSEVFVSKASELAAGIPNLSFQIGDGCALVLQDESFDVVVAHTTLCHVPTPKSFLREAYRVLKPGGWIAVFDGDYATATVATKESDPLERCVSAFRNGFVHDQWLIRRLHSMIRSTGFIDSQIRSHGYVEVGKAGYMSSWIERGADVLKQSKQISDLEAKQLLEEVDKRSANREWFGFISFGSLLARKP